MKTTLMFAFLATIVLTGCASGDYKLYEVARTETGEIHPSVRPITNAEKKPLYRPHWGIGYTSLLEQKVTYLNNLTVGTHAVVLVNGIYACTLQRGESAVIPYRVDRDMYLNVIAKVYEGNIHRWTWTPPPNGALQLLAPRMQDYAYSDGASYSPRRDWTFVVGEKSNGLFGSLNY